jgi:23S rRNA (guanine745-N1)-methyltransferase
VLDDVIAHLRCPVCGERLAAGGSALTCPRRHSFDIAKQGYVDLTAGRITHEGDTVAMVEARERAHRDHLLRSVVREVVTATAQARGAYQDTLIVEVGAGTGGYLAATLDAWPAAHGLAVDVSKPALRRAARAHPRMSAVRADVWRGLPLAGGETDILLDVFAPRSGEEFARIIRQDGIVVVAAAQPGHLAELTRPLGLLQVDPAKNERLHDSLSPWLTRQTATEIEETVDLGTDGARALIAMGPSAHHVDLDSLPADLPTTATIRVQVTTWTRT